MKTNFLIKALILPVIFIGLMGCEEEDIVTNEDINSQNEINSFDLLDSKTSLALALDPSFLVNEDNPFDKYGLDMIDFYRDLSVLYQDTVFSNYLLFEDSLNQLLNKYSSDLYPTIDTLNFDEYESNIISDFVTNLYVYNLSELTQEFETEILEDENLKESQKQRLLAFISLYKFNYYYQSEIMYMESTRAEPTWEERHHDCMVRELNQIFQDDGNPIPELNFIAGCPASVIWLSASCSWEATFGTN